MRNNDDINIGVIVILFFVCLSIMFIKASSNVDVKESETIKDAAYYNSLALEYENYTVLENKIDLRARYGNFEVLYEGIISKEKIKELESRGFEVENIDNVKYILKW